MLKKVMSLLLIMNIFIVNDLIKNKDINYISLQTSYPIATKVNEVTFQETVTTFYYTPFTSFDYKTNTIQNTTLTNTYTSNTGNQIKNLKHMIIVGFSLLGIYWIIMNKYIH